MTDYTNPPDTCSMETAADEQSATELGAAAMEVLPPEARDRIDVLWQSAEAAATQLDFPIDSVKEALVTLFQGRVSLITGDDELRKARQAVIRLVTAMIEGAQRRGFHVMNEFFLTEALFNLRPLFPFTD